MDNIQNDKATQVDEVQQQQFDNDELQRINTWGDILKFACLLNYIDTNSPSEQEPEKKYICQHIRRSILSALESLNIILSNDEEEIRRHYIELRNIVDNMTTSLFENC